MAISATITGNPFYNAVYTGSDTAAEKALSIIRIFNAASDRAKLTEDYNAFREYLTEERTKLDEAYAATLLGNPFPAKNELAQTLAREDDLPADILKKLIQVSQQYQSKVHSLQFLLNKNRRLRTAYGILAEAEENLSAVFTSNETVAAEKIAGSLETQANSMNMTTAPIPAQLEHLKNMTNLAAQRLTSQKEREAQRALKEYLDSGDAFRVKRELSAPERATFKRRMPAKAL